jgi:hypothetical protein
MSNDADRREDDRRDEALRSGRWRGRRAAYVRFLGLAAVMWTTDIQRFPC